MRIYYDMGGIMIYIINNSKSKTGKGDRVRAKVEDDLKTLGIPYELYHTDYAGHASVLAGEISRKDDDNICLILLGGDGTVNEVLNGISDFEKVRFAVIPNGSGNDFARGLGVTKDVTRNIDTIIKAYYTGTERRIDLGRVTLTDVILPGGKRADTSSSYFGISSGAGMDAIVTDLVNRSNVKKVLNFLNLGQLSYLLLTVYALFSMKTSNLIVNTGNPKRSDIHYNKVIFAAVMNMSAEGGGIHMAPNTSCSDGMLALCCAYGIPKWRTFFCLPLLVLKKHLMLKGFELKLASNIEMTFDHMTTLHADGEYLGDAMKAEFECLRGKLRMLQ